MSDLSFEINWQAYGPDELDALEGIEREQFLIAVESEIGEQVETPGQYAVACAAEFDDDPEEFGVDMYLITGGGENWVMWHFPYTDDGVLFVEDSRERVPIVLVSGEFYPRDKRWNGEDFQGEERAGLERLAEKLESAFNDREF